MRYEFSFNPRQWWGIVAACLVMLILAFAAGVVTGLLWSRSV